MRTINIYKAQHIGNEEVEDLQIVFNEELPIFESIQQSGKDFIRQAIILEKLLLNTLPGGTYDRLLGLMLKRKSSHFIVTHKDV